MYIFSSKNISLSEFSPKAIAKLRGQKFLEMVSEKSKMVKTASVGGNDVVTALSKAISEMNIKAEIDLSELFKRILSGSSSIEKTAEKKNSSKEETIKIASKEVKDSHYQIDISKDTVEKDGNKLIMLSAYVRDAYLGRYRIKRNFYFLPDNEKASDDAFESICSNINRIKRNYYDGRTTVSSIFKDINSVLLGVVADMKFEEEDCIGTTVKRD